MIVSGLNDIVDRTDGVDMVSGQHEDEQLESQAILQELGKLLTPNVLFTNDKMPFIKYLYIIYNRPAGRW